METGLAERFTASAEEWTCECGRVNVAGLSLCPQCGRVPPRGVATLTIDAVGPRRPAWQPKVRAVRLALGVIGLNILNAAFFLVLVRSGHMEASTAIMLATWLGLAFYGIGVAMMTGRLLTLRPPCVPGDPLPAVVLGAEAGLARALGLITLWSVAA